MSGPGVWRSSADVTESSPSAAKISVWLVVRRGAMFLLWILAAFGLLFLGTAAAAIFWRLPLAEWALRNALADAGVSARQLRVADLQIHRATIAPLEIVWKGQQLQADSITLDRPDMFSRSLGRVEVKGISVVLDLGALGATGPSTAAESKPIARAETSPPAITFDDLSLDGHLVLRSGQAEQSLGLSLSAKPDSSVNGVRARLQLDGPGLNAEGQGTYDLSRSTGRFDLVNCQLDLASLRRFLEPLLPPSIAGWDLGGKMTVTASLSVAEGRWVGQVELKLRGGALRSPDRRITFDGMAGDVTLAGPTPFGTPPAQQLVMKEAHIGDVALHDATVRFQLQNSHELRVESAEVDAFGGKVTTEAFTFDPAVVDYAVTLRCDGVRVEEILALFPTAKAKASGLADGNVPIRYGPQGISFSHGWLELKPGKPATLQIDEPGLLTGNLSPQNVAYPTMKAVETGLLNLRVEALRAEIYPPDAPAGRSVHILIAGEPLDPKVKAPVTFEVNVNGPVEKLIQWGLDSRMKFSTK